MIALFMFVLAIALAIALAPIILGVLGTMLSLLFTALLYLFAGCPHPGQTKHADPPAAAAPEASPRPEKDPLEQLEEWSRQDARRAADKALRAGKAAARKARESIDRGVLDAQRRAHEHWEAGHAEP